MLEIVVGKEKGKGKGGRRRERGCSIVFFLILFYIKHNLLFFSLFFNFLPCKKLHKHPPNKECNKHHKKFKLQIISFTQIPKILERLQQTQLICKETKKTNLIHLWTLKKCIMVMTWCTYAPWFHHSLLNDNKIMTWLSIDTHICLIHSW